MDLHHSFTRNSRKSMKNSHYQIAAIILFFLTLIVVPIFWIAPGRPAALKSIIEGRDLQQFPNIAAPDLQIFKTAAKRVLQGQPRTAAALISDHYGKREIQQQVERAASDQFPLRLTWIGGAKTLERGMIQMAYAFLDDPAIPADVQSGLVVMRDGSMIDARPESFNAETVNNIDKRIANYQELLNLYPRLNFYVYYIERLQASPAHPLNPYFPSADEGQAFKYFEAHKPEGLTVGELQITSMEDRLRYFYRTDHHWNIRGAWKAYEDIYRMIAPQFQGISPMLKLKQFKTLPGLKFYGSWARATFFPIQPDDFEVADVDMPPLAIYNRHGSQISDDVRAAYENGKYDTTPYVNHYASFGGSTDQFQFVNEKGPPRNLLVIGSSFTPPVIRFLASHYGRTYFVDLRQYEHFSLQEFMNSYPIDDVIVMGDSSAIENPDGIIYP